MGNYNLANKSGLDLSDYITLGGTKPVINQGQLLSDVNDQLPRNLTQDLGASTVQGGNILILLTCPVFWIVPNWSGFCSISARIAAVFSFCLLVASGCSK